MQLIFVEDDLEKKSQLLILVNNFGSTTLTLILSIILFLLTRTIERQKSGVSKVPNRVLGSELTPFIPLITMAVPLVGKLPSPSLLLPWTMFVYPVGLHLDATFPSSLSLAPQRKFRPSYYMISSYSALFSFKTIVSIYVIMLTTGLPFSLLSSEG